MKKRLFTIGLSLALASGLCACNTNTANTEPEKSLYTQGLELISLMNEMTENNSYINAYTGNGEISAIIQEIGADDYSKPEAVYALTFPESTLNTLTELAALENASEELSNSLKAKMPSVLMTQLNAMGGTTTLAATSVCTAGKTFVNHEMTENTTYLYTYADAAPIAVSFALGENHAISASGTFILYDGFTSGSAEEIESFFEEIGVDATLITE